VLPRNLHEPEDCRALSEVLSRVGDKWTVLVVWTLGDSPKRFNELRKALGSISQRMLTLTLRALERDGLVTVPYFRPFRRGLLGLWARKNRTAIHDARNRFDAVSRIS
jgi:DNA-binding HxlR family transcriptional regulator